MVVFCMKCGASLPPTADIIIRDGKEWPSPYYKCPACGAMAGEEAPSQPAPGAPGPKASDKETH